LNKDTLDKIRNLAKREKTSLNLLVNNILESYTQWELNAPQAGWALMLYSFLIMRIGKRNYFYLSVD
jgi:chemotaxis receptor (MCP) glutamine deamidase CheD